MINRPLITSLYDEDKKISLSIGLMKSDKSGSIESKIYKSEKNMLGVWAAEKLGIEGVAEKDYQMIEVRTREYFELGGMVSIDGKTLYVHSADSIWGAKSKEEILEWTETNDGSEYSSSVFYHVYKLCEKKRFEVPQIYNEKMIGTSLAAEVKEVINEKVKIKIICEEPEEKGITQKKEVNITHEKPYEFHFASVYTSQDGTGWYCMPEVGDKVRLYMPSEDESEAYVISSVHLEGGADRNNPDIKFIRNKFMKEVRFEEKKLKITNNNGTSITIDDNKGVIIKSNKEISISCTKDITLLSKSGKMDLSGKKEIMLKQGGSSSVQINNKVKFVAPNIKM